MGGGFNVGVNMYCDKVIYNDIDPNVINILKYFCNNSIQNILRNIRHDIVTYKLDKINKESYLKFRSDVNTKYKDTIPPSKLFTLICHSFSNQIRFNRKGEFNLPFGKRTFNDNIWNNLVDFKFKMNSKSIKFYNVDFNKFPIDILTNKSIVYCDPPYLVSNATYNKIWNDSKEKELYKFLDNLNLKGFKFILSNCLENNGNRNHILDNWITKNKYTIINLDYNYDTCNYQKSIVGNTIEIIVKNF